LNVLIAGGSGLIGSAICKHFKLDLGFDAYNYDFNQKAISYWLTAETPLESYFSNHSFDAFIDCSWPAKPSDQFKTWNTVVEHFKQQGHGKMILFSSIYGHKAPDFGMYEGTEIQAKPIEYAMLKAATEQATRYLAQKLKPWGIQVNCIAPGGVLNKESECFQEEYRTSGGVPMIQTKNLRPIIDALLHEDNAINGQVITVDGGWTL
jgi:NAD(P)-dependent dehydrogenase (short-subunit alcohol dehydrogenase family)